MSEKDISKLALLHIMNSAYCFPVSKTEIVLRLRTAKNDIINAEVIYESKYIIGQQQLTAKMEKSFTDGRYDYFTVKLKLKDTRLAYVFHIQDKDGWYYFSEDGITSDYDFTIAFYNSFQYPYINTCDIHSSVEWMKSAVVYQIFVERFNIGRKDKDMSYVNLVWGDIPNPKSFAGGDLKGISDKLDYLVELGFNAIYLTPVFRSISNHKYDISDYKQVDEHFGGNDDLRELIESAHSKGIRIILDAVFNHCSEELEQFQDVVAKGRKSPYHDWFVIYGDRPDPVKKNYEMFAGCTYMPKWNTSNPKVQQYLIDIALFWIHEYHIDGWRLDVSDEVSHDFWRTFRKHVKAENSEVAIIGENWHDASDYLRGDQYDSIMNYAFTKACLDYFAFGRFNAEDMANKLSSILMRNTDIANNMMLNLLDSHDTYRFIYEVKDNIQKLKAAISILMIFPGTPCIYYGTEIGLTGGFDPDNRRCMDWDKADESMHHGEVFHLIKKLSSIHKEMDLAHMSVRIYSENDILVIERTSSKQFIQLAVNNNEESKEFHGVLMEPLDTRLCVNQTER